MRPPTRRGARRLLLAPLIVIALITPIACARAGIAGADTGPSTTYPAASISLSLPVRGLSASGAGLSPLASVSLPSQFVLNAGQVVRLDTAPVDLQGNPVSGATLEWSAGHGAGTLNSDGELTATTRAGLYPDGVTATLRSGGEARSVSLPVAVTAGPIAQAILAPASTSVFTGDAIRLNLSALDQFGNPVAPVDLEWEVTDGEVIEADGAVSYRAGRSPGFKALRASVRDDTGATAVAQTAVLVEQGYCDTASEQAEWTVEWHAADPASGQLTGLLSAETSEVTPGGEWGEGPVVAGRADHVHMIARTQIVVRRHGPVSFAIGADDGFRVRLNGGEVPGLRKWVVGGYEERSAQVVLEPGVYDLELEYFEWAGDARLHFSVDPGVWQWERITGCAGAYNALPGVSSWVSDEPPEVMADRFGVSQAELVSHRLNGRSTLFFRDLSAPRKVILLQGLTTSASCGYSYRSVTASDAPLEGSKAITKTGSGWQVANSGFGLRSDALAGAVRAASVAGAEDLDAGDLIQFSYSGQYQDCGDSNDFIMASAHDGSALGAVYEPADTCLGVVPAAERLKELILRLDGLEPGVQVDLVGHSMGGMVAAYFMSVEPDLARRHVRSVVTLDSPLQGFPLVPLCGGHGPAVADILGHTPVVPAIRALGGTDLAARVISIVTTEIGSAIPGNPPVYVDCAGGMGDRLSRLGKAVLSAVGSIVGANIGGSDLTKGHNCAWEDEETLRTVAVALVR